MGAAFDFKKEYKDLYLPKTKPMLIDVPAMSFIAVAGSGNPNEENGDDAEALGLLYAFSCTGKMAKMGDWQPEGYFDYVVPPLEGLWWGGGFDGGRIEDKDALNWVSMIRQPDFVRPEVYRWAREQVAAKKPGLDVGRARLVRFAEGPCAQIMHKGPTTTSPPRLPLSSSSARRDARGTSPTRRAPRPCWTRSMRTEACPQCACTTRSTWAIRAARSRRTCAPCCATP